jgi:hypothetical protein
MNEPATQAAVKHRIRKKNPVWLGQTCVIHATIKVYDMCDEFDELDDFITLRQEDFAILRAMALEYGEPDVEEFLYRVLASFEKPAPPQCC